MRRGDFIRREREEFIAVHESQFVLDNPGKKPVYPELDSIPRPVSFLK